VNAGNRLVLSWRIGLAQIETDQAFDRMLGLIRRHRPVVGELARPRRNAGAARPDRPNVSRPPPGRDRPAS
jgi:hypothetical protein